MSTPCIIRSPNSFCSTRNSHCRMKFFARMQHVPVRSPNAVAQRMLAYLKWLGLFTAKHDVSTMHQLSVQYRDRIVSINTVGAMWSKYLAVVVIFVWPSCLEMMPISTPSARSCAAWVCRKPWACTRFSIPALKASRLSITRT